MHVLSFLNVGDFIPFFIFAIPIVAIVGGITAGIVRTIGQQRIIELSQRERIAALERGLDPSKLPPPPILPGEDNPFLPPHEHARRRSQGLMIGGMVTLAAGIAIGVFLGLVANEERNVWAVGLIPGAVGAALLLSAWIIRPRDGDHGAGAPPRVGS